MRELHKLLGQFGDGTIVGVEEGSRRRRQEGAGSSQPPSQPPTPMEVPERAGGFAPAKSEGAPMAMPLKKRPREAV